MSCAVKVALYFQKMPNTNCTYSSQTSCSMRFFKGGCRKFRKGWPGHLPAKSILCPLSRPLHVNGMNLFHGLCKRQILTIHGKFISLNQGHEIDNCKIHDHEKRFMNFSCLKTHVGTELWYGILIGCCCFSLIAVVGVLLPTLCSVNSLCCLWDLLLQVQLYFYTIK